MADTSTKAGVKTGVAFYAPLKSPWHPTPSGDRKIARLFMSALEQGGYHVELASQLRTFDKHGDGQRQARLIILAKKEAARVMRRWQKQGFRPQAWFSYHLYYKAPDLLGPIICQKLNIPYIVAEASWAEKRANGGWALYHQEVAKGLALASKVICINPIDKVALTEFYALRQQNPSPLMSLNTFIDDLPSSNDMPFGDSVKHSPDNTAKGNAKAKGNVKIHTKQDAELIRAVARKALADKYGLDVNLPWLISIAMMRSGDKHHSYQQLSSVVDLLQQPHQLLIVGAGIMQADVHTLFAQHTQVKFTGALENDHIRQLLPHFELLVWPAINEALGMIFLEAQQAGVAIVAGDQGGVSSIVKHNVTGRLVDAYNAQDMALAIDGLLLDKGRLKAMKQAAIAYVAEHHSIAASALTLKLVIEDARAMSLENTLLGSEHLRIHPRENNANGE